MNRINLKKPGMREECRVRPGIRCKQCAMTTTLSILRQMCAGEYSRYRFYLKICAVDTGAFIDVFPAEENPAVLPFPPDLLIEEFP